MRERGKNARGLGKWLYSDGFKVGVCRGFPLYYTADCLI